MTTITIEKEDLQLQTFNFDTIEDFIEAVEDYKLWKIMHTHTWSPTFDINILEKKYLWK